jgi:hypothetical protein
MKNEEEVQVTSIETYHTELKLDGLKPNSQYIIYLSAISTKTNMVIAILPIYFTSIKSQKVFSKLSKLSKILNFFKCKSNCYFVFQTSHPSETIVAWTNPIVPAFAESPAVHPNEGIVEGDSMTILCIALGTPTPTVTLYLGGHPIRSVFMGLCVHPIYKLS